jgi:hypothetical protein
LLKLLLALDFEGPTEAMHCPPPSFNLISKPVDVLVAWKLSDVVVTCTCLTKIHFLGNLTYLRRQWWLEKTFV